eukprot:sb/3462226/
MRTATSIKPPTPQGNAKVSPTPGSSVKLSDGDQHVPPSDLREPAFEIPTNLLPPLPPSPANENNTSQPEAIITSPTDRNGADDDVLEITTEVTPDLGSVTESQTPTAHDSSCDVKSVNRPEKPPEPQLPDMGHCDELTTSPVPTFEGIRREKPLITDSPLQTAPPGQSEESPLPEENPEESSQEADTRVCTEPITNIRPVGRFVPEETAKQILEKIKTPDLQVLSSLCGISNKSAASSIKALISSNFQLIYDGKAPLPETLATEVVNKLTSHQINTLLELGSVKFIKRAIVFDRRKILLDYWLLKPLQHDAPSARPKKHKGKRGKKKAKHSSFNKTLTAECVQSTSESEQDQECETKPRLLPLSLDPVKEEEPSPEQHQDSPGTSAVPTSPTEVSEQQLFLLEKSIIELRTDMDKNTHCLDLLLDEDPRKGPRQLPGVDELRKLIKSETQSLSDRCDSVQNLAREIQQLCLSQGAVIRDLQEELSSLRQSPHHRNTVLNGTTAVSNEAPTEPVRPESGQTLYSSVSATSELETHLPPRAVAARGNSPSPSSALARGHTSVRNQKRKAVILHDGTYDNFDQSLFASRYEVEIVNCPSLRKAASDERILRRVLDVNPFAVVVHLGSKDLYDGRSVNNTLNDAKHVIANLTKSAHTCMSLPIVPHSAEHQSFTGKLSQFNRTLTDQITYWRRSPLNGMKMKVFTCHKPMLTPSTRIFSSEPHLKVITDSGRRKLWAKLRDAMDRIAGLLPPRKSRLAHDWTSLTIILHDSRVGLLLQSYDYSSHAPGLEHNKFLEV